MYFVSFQKIVFFQKMGAASFRRGVPCQSEPGNQIKAAMGMGGDTESSYPGMYCKYVARLLNRVTRIHHRMQ